LFADKIALGRLRMFYLYVFMILCYFWRKSGEIPPKNFCVCVFFCKICLKGVLQKTSAWSYNKSLRNVLSEFSEFLDPPLIVLFVN